MKPSLYSCKSIDRFHALARLCLFTPNLYNHHHIQYELCTVSFTSGMLAIVSTYSLKAGCVDRESPPNWS